MRLWSLHPKYLDTKGLVALWREGLLAQAVLAGKTKGYRNHPQLNRFKESKNPLVSISVYLHHVCDEAEKRKYQFDRAKILFSKRRTSMRVTDGQIKYEWEHLLQKLKKRSTDVYRAIEKESQIELHPIFRSIPGKVEEWDYKNFLKLDQIQSRLKSKKRPFIGGSDLAKKGKV